MKKEYNPFFTAIVYLDSLIIPPIVLIDDLHSNSEYMIQYVGNPRVQTYRMEMPDIGEDYLLLNTAYDEAKPEGIGMAMWSKIKKIDGVEYVYPYFFDCSQMKNNIPITDPAEAEIYDEPAIISYMDENNIEHPKFEFKFELNDFIAQVRAMRGLK